MLLSGLTFGAERRNFVTPAHIERAFQRGTCPGCLAAYFLCDTGGATALDQSIVGWQRNVKELGMPRVVAVGVQLLQLTWQALGDLGLLRRYVERRGADGLAGPEPLRVLVRILELEGYATPWALDRDSDPDDAPFLCVHPGLDTTDVKLVHYSGEPASGRRHELSNNYLDFSAPGEFAGHGYRHAGGATYGAQVAMRPSPLERRLYYCPVSGRPASGANLLLRRVQATSRSDMVALGFDKPVLGMGALWRQLLLPALGDPATQRCPQLLDSAPPATARWFNSTEVSTAASRRILTLTRCLFWELASPPTLTLSSLTRRC